MAEKGYVFISYSSGDSEFVNRLTDFMINNNINYWKAPEMIPAGSNYAKEIPKAICECDIFLLVLSEKSQKSIWVEKEVDLAICHRKTVIPVQIDEISLNDMYRFYLNNVQTLYIQAKEIQKADFTELGIRIKGLLLENADKSLDDGKIIKKSNNNDLKKSDKRSNALRINRIPIECEFCGSVVLEDSKGVYKCTQCGRENYDDFQKVRNYLEKVGAAPAAVIARNTGVPMKTIEYFWNEEFLEIPKLVDIRMACKKCGAPIRTGYLCDVCKKVSEGRSVKSTKGAWRSEIWRK